MAEYNSDSKFERPLVGVTGPDCGGWPAWFATKTAVSRAGGKAVRITPSNPRSLDGLSALIIGGGADVDPGLYKEDRLGPQIRMALRREVKHRWYKKQALALIGYCPQNGLDLSVTTRARAIWQLAVYRIGSLFDLALLIMLWMVRQVMSLSLQEAREEQSNRDQLEVPLIREAISRGLPVLGICRGMQLLNVCMGGSLHQEVSVFYEESPVLQTLLPRKRVEIAADSKLKSIFRRSSMRVNSLHFQSVKTLGQGLRASAVEKNGVVQAIEYTGDSFVVGVQWHPEYLAFEESHRRIFKALITAAQKPNTFSMSRPVDGITEEQTIQKIAASQRIRINPIALT